LPAQAAFGRLKIDDSQVAFIERFPYHLPMTGSKPELLAALGWLVEAGADEAVLDEPQNRLKVNSPEPRAATLERQITVRSSANEPRTATPRLGATANAAKSPEVDPVGRASDIAAACNSLPELRSAIEAFDGCVLKRTATKTVFADGTPDYGIMLIGEAPGREEDLAGLPFVGRAGKLLDKMFASIGLNRSSNFYVTNVINWRPPGNRDPAPEEVASCLPFLRRHIELVSPALIVLLGAVSARHVMGRSDGIMRLRGRWLEYFVKDRMVPVMPILHPAYLLRRPIDKRLAWQDLQEIQAKVNSLRLLEQKAAHG